MEMALIVGWIVVLVLLAFVWGGRRTKGGLVTSSWMVTVQAGLRCNPYFARSGFCLQGLLHDRSPPLDMDADVGGEIIGEQVGDPYKPAAILTGGEHLHRRVVVQQRQASFHHGVSQPTPLVIHIDN